jgi:hypothetical protein
VTKTETLLPLDPIVFTPTIFRHTKRLPIRISRPSHKKFHFKNADVYEKVLLIDDDLVVDPAGQLGLKYLHSKFIKDSR